MLNRITIRRCLLTTLPLSVLACGSGSQVEPAVTVTEQTSALACYDDGAACVPHDSAPTVEEACLDAQWVALVDDKVTDCDSVEGVEGTWTGEPLFEGAAGGEWNFPMYCVYEWEGDDPEPNVLLSTSWIQQASPDCMVVGAQSESQDVSRMADKVREQVGTLNVGPVSERTVDIAVVDSSPERSTRGPVMGNSRHGHDVAQISRSVACPSAEGECPIEIRHHLALPLIAPKQADWTDGGYFGTQSQVARALYRALLKQTPDRALVINLSIGWDGRFGGYDPQAGPGSLPTPARAVRDALERASCAGALVIAAAGNTGGAESAEGPLFPGGWEQENAPTSNRCAEWGFKPRPSEKLPLVFSVGAVDGADRPLVSTRRHGRPAIAAPGQHVVVATDAGFTTPMTGSSAATAIVSGLAALLWSQVPEASTGNIMSWIYRSAVELESVADYCVGGSTCSESIRRVDACKALTLACNESGACAAPEECNTRAAYSDARFKFDPSEFDNRVAAAAKRVEVKSLSTLPPVPLCGSEAIVNASGLQYPEFPCPARQLSGVSERPFAFEQPGSNPCPICGGRQTLTRSLGNDVLYLEIDPAFGYAVSDPVLHLEGDADVVLPAMSLSPGDTVAIVGVSLSSGRGAASVSFVVRDSRGTIIGATESALIIE